MSDIVEECAFIVRLLKHAISTRNNFLKASPHTFKDTYIHMLKVLPWVSFINTKRSFIIWGLCGVCAILYI